jgi:hypothetical protein
MSTTNINSTEVVENQNLNNEVSSITISGEFQTVVETTIEINDQEKFLSYFPNNEFDEDVFLKLLYKGKFDDEVVVSKSSFSLGEIRDDEKLSNYTEVYDLMIEN